MLHGIGAGGALAAQVAQQCLLQRLQPGVLTVKFQQQPPVVIEQAADDDKGNSGGKKGAIQPLKVSPANRDGPTLQRREGRNGSRFSQYRCKSIADPSSPTGK